VRTWVIDAPGAAPRKLFERSSEDSYSNPGTPLRQARNSGTDAVFQNGDNVFMTGVGSSPQGDRPFLDRFNIKTGQKERIFQTEDQTYEPVLALLADDGSKFVTRFETRTSPPQVTMRGRESNSRRMLTSYPDPAPALQGVKSEMVTYKRADGVQMRATIHTPPGWTKEKGRLPALLWAYPQEFTDPDMASQVTGSQYRFTTPGWGTLHMLFLTQGYAIIDDPKMPIVGPGETANDTYIQQLVSSAQAAVDKAVELGIVDRDRVVAGGHSYGAFMTANLLAHSDIFRAGIARSGAYNRSLTPFGFQNEERTFWQVPQLYANMSPFNYADKIKEPILLIHGEADDNAGTYPIQSERFYRALKGHGATVRYVTLPFEAHGYTARESVLHTVAEMLNWANEWAKNAKPRTTSEQRQQ
jgi:dipeptidyl aminopeptidase/acylaminoacyl peptidase